MTEHNITFSQMAERWSAYKRNVVKHSTFCAYQLILKTHLLPHFGLSTSISEEEAQRFVFDKLNAGLSRKSTHDIIAVLKSVLKYTAKHLGTPFTTWDIEYPTETEKRPLPVLSISDHKRLLKELTASPTPQNIGVMVALSTGMRIGEICGLKWENVDMVRRVITVETTVSRIYNCETGSTEQYESSPKTRKSNREIPISQSLYNALRTVRKAQPQAIYVVGKGDRHKEPRTYRETFRRLLKRLSIPNIVFHSLRHTFATRCIESQCDYKTVSVILGHSNVSTTLNLYGHPNLDQKKRCLQRLNKFLGQPITDDIGLT